MPLSKSSGPAPKAPQDTISSILSDIGWAPKPDQTALQNAGSGQSDSAGVLESLLFPLQALQINAVSDPLNKLLKGDWLGSGIESAASIPETAFDSVSALGHVVGLNDFSKKRAEFTPSQVLRQNDVPLPKGPWSGFGTDVAIDILTDPITYVTLGTGGGAKAVGEVAAEGIGKILTEGGVEVAGEAAPRISSMLQKADKSGELAGLWRSGALKAANVAGDPVLKDAADRVSLAISNDVLGRLASGTIKDLSPTERELLVGGVPKVGLSRAQRAAYVQDFRAGLASQVGADVADKLVPMAPKDALRYGTRLSVGLNLPFGDRAVGMIRDSFHSEPVWEWADKNMLNLGRKGETPAAVRMLSNIGEMFGVGKNGSRSLADTFHYWGQKLVDSKVAQDAEHVGANFSTTRVPSRRFAREVLKDSGLEGADLAKARAAQQAVGRAFIGKLSGLSRAERDGFVAWAARMGQVGRDLQDIAKVPDGASVLKSLTEGSLSPLIHDIVDAPVGAERDAARSRAVARLVDVGGVDERSAQKLVEGGEILRTVLDESHKVALDAGLGAIYRTGYLPHVLTPEGKALTKGLLTPEELDYAVQGLAGGFTKQRRLLGTIDEINEYVRGQVLERARAGDVRAKKFLELNGPDFKFFTDDPVAATLAHAHATRSAVLQKSFVDRLEQMASTMGWDRPGPGTAVEIPLRRTADDAIRELGRTVSRRMAEAENLDNRIEILNQRIAQGGQTKPFEDKLARLVDERDGVLQAADEAKSLIGQYREGFRPGGFDATDGDVLTQQIENIVSRLGGRDASVPLARTLTGETKRVLENVPAPIARIVDNFFSVPKDPGAFFQFYRKALSAWKRMATSILPFGVGFHMRNFYSNMFNAYMAGVRDPKDLFDAARVVQVLGKASEALRESPHLIAEAGGERKFLEDFIAKSHLPDDIKKVAVQYSVHGVVGNESITTMLGAVSSPSSIAGGAEHLAQGALDATWKDRAVQRAQKVGLGAPVAWGLHPVETSGHFGNAIEDASRLAVAIHASREGMSPEAASLYARAMMVDYGDLTQFEKKYVVDSGLSPFYTWFRREASLLATWMMTQPSYFSKLLKFHQAAWRYWTPDSEFIPEYYRDVSFPLPPDLLRILPFHLGQALKGGAAGKGAFFSPPDPVAAVVGQLQGLAQPSIGDIALQVAGKNLNPAITSVLASMTGKQPFSGSPLLEKPVAAQHPLDWLAELGVPVPGVWIDPKTGNPMQTQSGQFYTEQMLPLLGKARTMFPTDAKDKERQARRNLSTFTGLPTLPLGPQTEKGEAYRRLADVQQIMNRLQMRGYSPKQSGGGQR